MEKGQETSQRIFKIKELIAYTPLATAGLIFFGFLNYDLYYRKLQIEIFSFLETSELIFSFVNLIYPIIVSSILMILFAYLRFSVDKERNVSKKEIRKGNLQYEEKSKLLTFNYSFKGIFSNLKRMFLELKGKKIKNAFSLFIIIFEGFSFRLIIFLIWVFEIVVGLILMVYTVSLDTSMDLTSKIFEINSVVYLGLSVVWVCILSIYTYGKFTENDKKLAVSIYSGIVLLVLIANLNIHQAHLASDTLNDLNIENVRFEYKGKKYTTSDTKSLIGVTKNYLFLRETITGENLIFKLSEVSNMVFFYDESLRKKSHNHND